MYAPTHTSAGGSDLPSVEQARAAADLLRLLADPTRLRLLAALAHADHLLRSLPEHE